MPVVGGLKEYMEYTQKIIRERREQDIMDGKSKRLPSALEQALNELSADLLKEGDDE